MKIEVWKRNIRTKQVSEQHELTLGKYNEFYLPSIGLDSELWIKVTDDEGESTTLHLKR